MSVSSIQYLVPSSQKTHNRVRETGNGKRETKPSTQCPVPSTQRDFGAARLLKTTNGIRATGHRRRETGDGIWGLAGNWLLATGYPSLATREDATRCAA
jgi:hypothetical protein